VTIRNLLRTLGRYNRWANRRLYEVCHALEGDAYRADRGAFFGSIHRTLNHILVGDRAWLGRLEGVDRGIRALDQILYDDLPALTDARTKEDARIIAFVDGLDAERLDAPLVYRTIAGEAQETPTGLVVLHMINHATHHRGQVHCMLSQIPTDPPPLDLIYYLREKG
jgi:uncharacterized damage-inducible protein DinB